MHRFVWSCSLRINVILFIFGYLTIVAGDYIRYPSINREYKFHNDIQKWYDAKEICKREGAQLAMPMSSDESRVLASIFNDHPTNTIGGWYPNRVLLNFHDLFGQGEFIAENGNTVQYGYHKWSKGEPKMDNERCGSMDRTGDLDDFPCERKAAFICQKGAGVDASTLNKLCSHYDTEYKEYNNKCYKFHIDPKTWRQARAICHAEGGFLSIVSNKAEEDHLVQLINKPENMVTHVVRECLALIGFHDLFKRGVYMWVSGHTFDEIGYINHRAASKSKFDSCGSLDKHGGFLSVPCDLRAPFICERNINV